MSLDELRGSEYFVKLRELLDGAAERIEAGNSGTEVKDWLVASGVAGDEANSIVNSILTNDESFLQYQRSAGKLPPIPRFPYRLHLTYRLIQSPFDFLILPLVPFTTFIFGIIWGIPLIGVGLVLLLSLPWALSSGILALTSSGCKKYPILSIILMPIAVVVGIIAGLFFALIGNPDRIDGAIKSAILGCWPYPVGWPNTGFKEYEARIKTTF